ncbi:MAG: OmpP1/FadL family transporter, partial [Nitrospinota bacterium]
MNNRLFLYPAFFLLTFILVSSTVYGAGFALFEHSASAVGTAFSGGAAIADEGSTVFFNPAGMSRLEREFQATVPVIYPQIQFRNEGSKAATVIGGADLSGSDDDSNVPAVPVSLFYVMPVNDSVRLGLGFFVPFGLTTKYDDTWVGRYHGVKSEIMTFNLNPSFSYKISELISVGAGFNVQRMDAKLESAVDIGLVCVGQLKSVATCDGLGLRSQESDGFVSLDGDSWAYGWNAGFLISLSENTRIGFSYRSEVDHDLEGTADFRVPAGASFLTDAGLFIDTDVTAAFRLPDSASISVFHKYGDLSVMADLSWMGWSVFDELRVKYKNTIQPDSVTTEAWEDNFRYSLGINYDVNKNLVLRGGVAYDETPVPNANRRTVRVPDNNRTWLTLGAGFQPTEGIFLDIGYAHLFLKDSK